MDMNQALIGSIRAEAADLPVSGLIEIFNYGSQREGVIPLWSGEGDLPTPAFICDAAADAFRSGETFYTHQRGIPTLRSAIASYCSSLYRTPISSDEVFVTCGGMQAINVAIRLTTGPGQHVVIPSPTWPNFSAAAEMAGARPRYVPMELRETGWHLDIDRLSDACGNDVSAVVINSPANPTGWTASLDDLQAILDMARKRGIWIIADEIYGRFFYEGTCAPSFQNIREPDDRILFINSFSKNWAMTGWRLGWLQAPAELGQIIESLIQYKSMGVATALQWAGVAALERGDDFVQSQIARATTGRDIVCKALRESERAVFANPDGAFYLLIKIEGMDRSMDAAKRIIDEAKVGLAPGIAFGADGEGYFRICFANSPEQLEEAMGRFMAWLKEAS